MSVHRFAIGDAVFLDFDRQLFSKLNPFTIEAQMPPVGPFLQYRIKSKFELCRRVVSEHQISAFGSQSHILDVNAAGSAPVVAR